MEKRIPVTLDFSKCRYHCDLYAEMREKMEWEDDYGSNLSALWDILWGMTHKGNDFTILRPRKITNAAYGENERFTEYVDKICGIFQRAQSQRYLTVKIQYFDEERSGD